MRRLLYALLIERYAKICRLYCKDTLAGIIDKWELLKGLAAQADVSIRHAGLTEFDDYKRSFVARMFYITSFRMTLGCSSRLDIWYNY